MLFDGALWLHAEQSRAEELDCCDQVADGTVSSAPVRLRLCLSSNPYHAVLAVSGHATPLLKQARNPPVCLRLSVKSYSLRTDILHSV